jgi:hypothetical protein
MSSEPPSVSTGSLVGLGPRQFLGSLLDGAIDVVRPDGAIAGEGDHFGQGRPERVVVARRGNAVAARRIGILGARLPQPDEAGAHVAHRILALRANVKDFRAVLING